MIARDKELLGAGGRRSEGEAGAAVEDADTDEPAAIRCAQCELRLTTADAGVERGGAHRREFTNPAGIIFRVRAFRWIAACKHLGNPTSEHSWFPGYAWRIALCPDCGTHLGWGFESGEDRFHGLIATRIVER